MTASSKSHPTITQTTSPIKTSTNEFDFQPKIESAFRPVRARYPSRTLSINARRKSAILSISEAEFLISSSQATCRGARFPPTTNLGTSSSVRILPRNSDQAHWRGEWARKVEQRLALVRFSLSSGHPASATACPFCAANRRHLAATSLGRFVGVERAVERSRSCSLPV